MVFLRVKKLVDHAVIPSRQSAGSAGYDLASAEDTVVPPKGKKLIDTGLSIAVEKLCYGRIAPRSGLAKDYFIDVGAGVIDSDYRGPVKVLLYNFSDEDFTVKRGDRIAQLIIEKIEHPTIMEVDALDDTGRGDAGFGSTGGTSEQTQTRTMGGILGSRPVIMIPSVWSVQREEKK